MIFLNGVEVEFKKFPNGESNLITKSVLIPASMEKSFDPLVNILSFKYEEDGDLIKLAIVKDFLDYQEIPTSLVIYYMPYSRMDRVEGNNAFSLKTVAKQVNDMNFLQVIVIEPHSDVTCALLDRSVPYCINSDLLPKVCLDVDFRPDTDYLFFPDAGAQKRYQSLKGFKQLVGYKHRDFESGKIESLQVVGDFPSVSANDSKIIIVDDLCSYGGTFMMSAEKLKELGFQEIYLLVAHCEKSVFNGKLLLEGSPIKKIFTTDSIISDTESPNYEDHSDKITIYKLEELLK